MVKTYGWSASVIGETELLAVHDLPRVGFVARFGRRVDGVAVLPGQLKILMRRDGALVAAGGNLGPVVAPGKAHFSLNGVEALAEAISKESGVAVSPANLMSLGEQGDFQRFQLQGGLPLHIPEAARVKPVWFATEGRLAPAFFPEFYVSSPTQVESYAVRIIVDADTLITATFAPNPVIPGSTVTMTIGTSPAATPGSFPAPIQASSDAISHTLDTTIAVFPEAQPLWLPLLRVGD